MNNHAWKVGDCFEFEYAYSSVSGLHIHEIVGQYSDWSFHVYDYSSGYHQCWSLSKLSERKIIPLSREEAFIKMLER